MDAFEEQPDSAAAPAADPFAGNEPDAAADFLGGGEPDPAADFLGKIHQIVSPILLLRIYEFFLRK